MNRLLLVLLLPACIQTEASVSRSTLVGGTAEHGGLGVGMNGAATTYRETGTQNIAAGMSFHFLEATPEGYVTTLGAAARFAQQIDSAGRWRVIARASFELGPCQVSTCSAMHAPEHRYSFDGLLGFERMLIAPEPNDPQNSSSVSAEVGLVYTHMHDAMLGLGDFVGVGIGLRAGLNMMSGSHAGGSR